MFEGPEYDLVVIQALQGGEMIWAKSWDDLRFFRP